MEQLLSSQEKLIESKELLKSNTTLSNNSSVLSVEIEEKKFLGIEELERSPEIESTANAYR